MITQIRLLILLARPAVLYLLGLYAAIGAESAGGATRAEMAKCVATVVGFVLFSVALNDLADERIDQVNLHGDRRRPLANGAASRMDMKIVAAVAGLLALAGAIAMLSIWAVLVTVIGLLVSATYSLEPVRIADRGIVAPLVLPACYVAVPYLLGTQVAGGHVTLRSIELMAGLYLGFIGRILLKDFRDVRGDRLFGKRTFLVRHGRTLTCYVAFLAWTAGTVVIAAAQRSLVLDVSYALGTLAAWTLLRQLAEDDNRRREEIRISALAILGRGTMLVLLVQLYVQRDGYDRISAALAVLAMTVLTGVLVARMLIRGPRSGLTSAALRHINANREEAADIVAR